MITYIVALIIVFVILLAGYYIYTLIKKNEATYTKRRLSYLLKLKKQKNAKAEAEAIYKQKLDEVKKAEAEYNKKKTEAEEAYQKKLSEANSEHEQKKIHAEEQYNRIIAEHDDRLRRLMNPTYHKADTDCEGYDIANKKLDTADQCMKWCDDNDSCVGAVYIGGNRKDCYLKSDLKGCHHKYTDRSLIIKDVHKFKAEEARLKLEYEGRQEADYAKEKAKADHKRAELQKRVRLIKAQIKDKSKTINKVVCDGGGVNMGNKDNIYQCLNASKDRSDSIGIGYNPHTKACYSMKYFKNCRPHPHYVMNADNKASFDEYHQKIKHAFEDRKRRLLDKNHTKSNLSCPGNNISDIKGVDQSACLKLCDDKPSCKLMEYDKAIKKCWLKHNVSDCHTDDVVNSVISLKNPSDFESEAKRLKSILTPEEAERGRQIDHCKTLDLPEKKTDWTTYHHSELGKCKKLGVLY